MVARGMLPAAAPSEAVRPEMSAMQDVRLKSDLRARGECEHSKLVSVGHCGLGRLQCLHKY